MIDREIRATLRSAVERDVLDGWYAYDQRDGRRYVVAPPRSSTVTQRRDEASMYCPGLRAMGVEPIYRDSEPTAI